MKALKSIKFPFDSLNIAYDDRAIIICILYKPIDSIYSVRKRDKNIKGVEKKLNFNFFTISLDLYRI